MHYIFLLFFFVTNVYAHSTQEYLTRANTALKNRKPHEALSFVALAEKTDPTNDQILLSKATIYYLMNQFDRSCECYEQFLKKRPEHLNTMYNCATTYCKQGKFSHAIPMLEQLAQRISDDAVKAALFKLYLRSQAWKKAASINPPSLWWYNENIYGKTILLELDKPGNGLGDAIQFVRYAQNLKQAGARVVVKVHDPLLPLFSRCPFIDQLISENSTVPRADKTFGICIASLMMRSKDRVSIPSHNTPYLYANPDHIALWKNRLNSDKNYKVGICWQSNFVQEKLTGEIKPSPRAAPIEAFTSLSKIPNISLYSLQKSDTPIHAPFALKLKQWNDDFDESRGRFMDTAALIMNLDLVVTVDTSIAHLAGALGKPVWLMLSCESDYRWFMNRNDTPWYPTMRLFRQTEPHNWHPVIQNITSELQRNHT